MAGIEVLLHPNYGDRCVKIDLQAYHWNGGLGCYCRGYGPYANMPIIGEWRVAQPNHARRIVNATNARA